MASILSEMMINVSNEIQTRHQGQKDWKHGCALVQGPESLASDDSFKKASECLLDRLRCVTHLSRPGLANFL